MIEFKNEKEAYEYHIDLLQDYKYDDRIFAKDLTKIAKQKGYIKQSELEKAKEEYRKNYPADLHDANNYIEKLEKEITELKKILQMHD